MIEDDRTRGVFLSDFGAHIMVGGEQIAGIFDSEYQAVGSDGLVISSAQPAVWIKTADLQALNVRPGDSIEVNDETYVVYEHQPDGTGMSVVLLHVPP